MIYYTLEYRELTYRNGDQTGYHYWCFGESFEKEVDGKVFIACPVN